VSPAKLAAVPKDSRTTTADRKDKRYVAKFEVRVILQTYARIIATFDLVALINQRSSHKMSIRQPMAFLSYVRSDDDHDHGRITTLRQRLEGEVKVQTGRAFPIFQDRNDIAWGQQWAEAIRNSLAGVTFLIPILTPSFFESPACRSELETFLLNEATLGTNRLILPLYYVTCDQLESEWTGDDPAVSELRKRNWTDWRKFRFTASQDVEMAAAVADLASSISCRATYKPDFRRRTKGTTNYNV
jgi:hypothetical protein